MPNYRRRMVRQPREVLAEFGLNLPADVDIRVHDSNQKSRFMVMPMRPESTDGWSEERLAAIVTRDRMIGVALPDLDRTPVPWEGNVQATCECLSWCGTLDHLERRHAEDELGETVYAELPVHARSVLVTAHTLLDRGEISEEELEAKMKEVRSRFESA
jgi:hypothetical protein